MTKSPHLFHIPVMGTSFTIDTPVKVARFGISSVLTIGDDELCETMRQLHTENRGHIFTPISKTEPEYRRRRITAYLNLLDEIVKQQIEVLRQEPFEPGTEIMQYFEMLPDRTPLKQQFIQMCAATDPNEKSVLQQRLRTQIQPGSIDVNIMTKVDRPTFDKDGNPNPPNQSEALRALEGYALSTLNSAIVFSAGFNGRLYGHIENFPDFFPDENGKVKKRVILKVSDFRSSETQGRFLAKKGIWVWEHRIESGLNCGGHAFVKDGQLMGPILETFKSQRHELSRQFFETVNKVLAQKGMPVYARMPESRLTVQGGIGTGNEQNFLLDYYQVDCTGWASPFLLVPEASTLDDYTRELIRTAKSEDLYLSGVSPLGVPFNTVRGSLSHQQRDERLAAGKPGSPCPKHHLALFAEFSEKLLCTASRVYQAKKLELIKELNLSQEDYKKEAAKITEKLCLCEDLAAPALVQNGLTNGRALKPLCCPGPNVAFFDKLYSLTEMVSHIYGRINLLADKNRPNVFVNELMLNIDFLKNEILDSLPKPTQQQVQRFQEIRDNLMAGIDYYKHLVPEWIHDTQKYREAMTDDLAKLKNDLEDMIQQYAIAFTPATATV